MSHRYGHFGKENIISKETLINLKLINSKSLTVKQCRIIAADLVLSPDEIYDTVSGHGKFFKNDEKCFSFCFKSSSLS